MSYWVCKAGVCVLPSLKQCVCCCYKFGSLLEFKQIFFCWPVPLTVLYRRRPGPKGDWTSPHPWDDCGPTRGELCWSRARHRHRPSPARRPSDPNGEHLSVKKEGSSKSPLYSAGPRNRFECLESNIRQVTQTHWFTPGLHAPLTWCQNAFWKKWLPFLLFCWETRNLILQSSCPAIRLHMKLPLFYILLGIFKIGLQSLARLEADGS